MLKALGAFACCGSIAILLIASPAAATWQIQINKDRMTDKAVRTPRLSASVLSCNKPPTETFEDSAQGYNFDG
jgi:hypothetical protein